MYVPQIERKTPVENLPFGREGRFWRGNMHTHSTRSDGRLPPEEVVATYRDAGYNFLVLSDHFLERYSYPVIDSSRKRSSSHSRRGVTTRVRGRRFTTSKCTTVKRTCAARPRTWSQSLAVARVPSTSAEPTWLTASCRSNASKVAGFASLSSIMKAGARGRTRSGWISWDPALPCADWFASLERSCQTTFIGQRKPCASPTPSGHRSQARPPWFPP